MRALKFLAITLLSALIGVGLWIVLQPFSEASSGPRERPAEENLNPRVGPTIKVGPKSQVSAVLFAAGSVWATRYDVPGPDTLVRIDPATNKIVARISLPAVPGWETGGGAMAAGDGSVWVTGGSDKGKALLLRIDPATNRVASTIHLEARWGADVAVDDAGAWVTAFGQGSDMKLFRVDPTTNSVVATIPIPGHWVREVFAIEGGIVVRSLDAGTTFTLIDPNTNDRVLSQRISGSTGAVGAWDGYLWATSRRGVIRIDPHSLEPLGEPIKVGKSISWGSLVGGDGHFWFVGDDRSDVDGPVTVDRFTVDTNRIDTTVEPKRAPTALALTPDSIWGLNYGGSVTRINLR